MEKLRKALEKRAASIHRGQARKGLSVKNEAQEVIARCDGSKPAGPFAGGMEDTDQLHHIGAHAIRNDVRRSRDD